MLKQHFRLIEPLATTITNGGVTAFEAFQPRGL